MRRVLAMAPLLLIFINGCAYKDFNKPNPTEVFAGEAKVLFIGIDGVRYDAITASIAPNIYSLMQEDISAFTTTGINEDITLSGPNWTTLLTGVHYSKHKVKNNLFIHTKLKTWPSIFHRLESTYINIKTASIVHWAPINKIIVRHSADIRIETDDIGVRDEAISLLETEFVPDFMFLHFDDVDHAGHSSGFSPDIPAYSAAVSLADNYVGSVLEAMRSRTTFADENWLIIITTDHGGEGTGHGGGANNPNIRNVFSVFNGRAVTTPGHFERPVHHVDIAVTVLKHLGLSYDNLDGEAIGID